MLNLEEDKDNLSLAPTLSSPGGHQISTTASGYLGGRGSPDLCPCTQVLWGSPELRPHSQVPRDSPELRPCTCVPLGITRVAAFSAPLPADIPFYSVLATAQRLGDAAPRRLIPILRLQEAAVQELCGLLPVGEAGGSQTLDLLRGVACQHVPTRLEYHNRWQLTDRELAPEVPAERALSASLHSRCARCLRWPTGVTRGLAGTPGPGHPPSKLSFRPRRLPLAVSTCCMYLYCFASVNVTREVLGAAISNSEAS